MEYSNLPEQIDALFAVYKPEDIVNSLKEVSDPGLKMYLAERSIEQVLKNGIHYSPDSPFGIAETLRVYKEIRENLPEFDREGKVKKTLKERLLNCTSRDMNPSPDTLECLSDIIGLASDLGFDEETLGEFSTFTLTYATTLRQNLLVDQYSTPQDLMYMFINIREDIEGRGIQYNTEEASKSFKNLISDLVRSYGPSMLDDEDTLKDVLSILGPEDFREMISGALTKEDTSPTWHQEASKYLELHNFLKKKEVELGTEYLKDTILGLVNEGNLGKAVEVYRLTKEQGIDVPSKEDLADKAPWIQASFGFNEEGAGLHPDIHKLLLKSNKHA